MLKLIPALGVILALISPVFADDGLPSVAERANQEMQRQWDMQQTRMEQQRQTNEMQRQIDQMRDGYRGFSR